VGRPGDRIAGRPDRSEIRFRLLTAIPRIRALRQPIESALAAGIAVVNERDVGAGCSLVQRHSQRVEAQVVRMCDANCQPTILTL